MDDSRVTVLEGTGNETASAPTQAAPIHSIREPKLKVAKASAASATNAKRMRSVNLTLVLMGTAALGGLTGCGNLESNKGTSRDVYANLEACKADWGNPGDCEEVPSTAGHSSGVGSSRGYYGPRYSSRSGSTGFTSDARPGSRSSGTISSSSVSRGGFGASASRHGGGSSSSSHSSGG